MVKPWVDQEHKVFVAIGRGERGERGEHAIAALILQHLLQVLHVVMMNILRD
jgi:hypothetical protein